MKKNRLIQRVVSIALAMMLMLAVAMPTFATDVTAVNDAKDGVLQMRVYVSYVLEKGADANVTTDDSWLFATGTCFLINDTTVITNAHLADEATLFSDLKNISTEDWDIEVKVVVKNDVELTATMINYSADMDFAILELEQPITGKTPLTLASDSYLDTVSTAQTVTALGFPSRFAEDIQTAIATYDSDSITVTTGTITAITDTIINNKVVPVYMHSATLSGGNSGGPLVDNSGVVLGINTWGTLVDDTQDYYALRIEEITEILNYLGIEYTSTDSASILPEVEVEPEVEETPEVEEAVAVVDPTPAPTVEPIPDPTPDNTLYIILGVVAVVIVGIVVVLVVVLGKGKKSAGTPVQSTYVSPVAPAAPTGPIQGAGDTSVLNQGAGDTTVLNTQNYGSFTRQKTGEKIVMNNPRFTIGKEKGRVNYAVAGNNAISRTHVALEAKNGIVYISDCNTTNGTFLNGAKLTANQEVALSNGAKITMGEEEFIFNA